MVLFLLVEFLFRIVIRFGCDNSPVIYRDYLKVIKVDGINNIWGTARVSFVFLFIPNRMGYGCWV